MLCGEFDWMEKLCSVSLTGMEKYCYESLTGWKNFAMRVCINIITSYTHFTFLE